ncbi:MAG TPA: TetR family transcriptional regulator [Opitutaceae bacterium]
MLRHAVQIASLQGLDGVTFGQVAAAASVSKGHLAQLFGDREALQLATIEAVREIYAAHVAAGADAAPTARERLRRHCLGWFDYVEGRVLPGGCLITAANSEFRTIDGAVRDRLILLRKEQRDFLRTLIVAALAERASRRTIDAGDLVYQFLAYRAAANVSLFLDDTGGFAHAKRATASLLEVIDPA